MRSVETKCALTKYRASLLLPTPIDMDLRGTSIVMFTHIICSYVIAGMKTSDAHIVLSERKLLFSHIILSAVKGFILVARRFIFIARTTHAIAIAIPSPKRMLNVTGLG